MKTLLIIAALVIAMAVMTTETQQASSWTGKAYTATETEAITQEGAQAAAQKAILRIVQDAGRELGTTKLKIRTMTTENDLNQVTVSAVVVSLL